MKHNYLLYIILFFIVLFRGPFIVLINNIGSLLFIKDESLEVNVLKSKIKNLELEYNSLIDFKNNINIKEEYIITNLYMNNYSFDKLLINGDNYNINDEVVNNEGLIGLIKETYLGYSEVEYIYNTNIAVKINDAEGKIVGKTDDNNLIIKQLSNYNNININDKVISTYNTYIGKVIKINKLDVDTSIIVETVNLKNNHYVAVLSR